MLREPEVWVRQCNAVSELRCDLTRLARPGVGYHVRHALVGFTVDPNARASPMANLDESRVRVDRFLPHGLIFRLGQLIVRLQASLPAAVDEGVDLR